MTFKTLKTKGVSDRMGPHPKKLIVRTFTPKPSRYAEKVKAKIAVDTPPAPKAVSSPHAEKSAPAAATTATAPATPVMTPRSPLSPEERARRRRARSETLARLKETYPALMVPPLPLPIGFGDLMFVRAQEAGHSLFAVISAIKFHCNGIAYLEALAAEGVIRCDLDGIPLEPVAAKQQAFAKNRLAEIAAKRGAAKLPNDLEVSTRSNSQPQR